ncbi:MAG: single-stranded DNA-binding protein [Candidatus Algichlamydia australiensis]|nr:single-stranded DNA-binding protein [Chlamydiales bacterium]
MNYLMIAGRLGADPEVRFTSNGQKVTTMRVAANTRRGKNEETIWWRVTIWGDQFEKMMPYLKKGTAVMIWGDMAKPEMFTDREGKNQISMNMTATNISFSPFGRSDAEKQQQPAMAAAPKPQQQQPQQAAPSQEQTFGSGDFGSFGGSFGTGEADNTPFNDEEIPF